MLLLGSLLEYETDVCLPAGCGCAFKTYYLDLNSAFVEERFYGKQTKHYHSTDLCEENTEADLCASKFCIWLRWELFSGDDKHI